MTEKNSGNTKRQHYRTTGGFLPVIIKLGLEKDKFS